MSKLSSHDLFELINSLSKSEKKYFKQYAAFHTIGDKNKIVVLFDLIAAQKFYDEKKILSAEKSISAKQLVDLKIRLYKAILNSLNSYYAVNNKDIQIKNMITSIGILLERGLFSQCEKLIRKAKILAQQYERLVSMLELVQLEKELFKVAFDRKKTHHDIYHLFKKENYDLIDLYKISCEYDYLSALLLYDFRKRGETRSAQDTKLSEKIVNHPLLRQINPDLPVETIFNSFSSIFIYLIEKKKYKQSISGLKKLISLIELRPLIIKEYPKYYISSIANLLGALANYKVYNDAPVYIDKLKNIETRSPRLTDKLFHLINSYELNYYYDLAKFDEALKLAKAIGNRLTDMEAKGKFTMSNQFDYAFSCLYMVTGNYATARKYLNRIINDKNGNYREDIQCFARIMNLIAHYESGNEDYLAAAIKSTYRFLFKKNKLYKVEGYVMDFLRKQLIRFDKAKEIQSFKKLRNQLLPLRNDKYESFALRYFDIIAWLEGKIENSPMAEILKQNCRLRQQSLYA